MVTLATLASEEPPASSTAFRFSQTWRVSGLIPPSMRRPVFGSTPSWPDANTQSPTLIACESGTRAGGTLSVCTTVRFISLASDLPERVFPGQPTVCELQDVDPALASIAPVGQPHVVGPLGESVIANDHHPAGVLAEHVIVAQHVSEASPA